MHRESIAPSYDQPKKTAGEILVSNQFQHRTVMCTARVAKGLHTHGSIGAMEAQGCWAAKGKGNASVWPQRSAPADKS